jgi:hypothetical protein
LRRSFQASLPTSQSKLSVCSARRSGTVRVSVILANESRDAVRPVMVDFLEDAERAAAKENNLRETCGSQFMVGRWDFSSATLKRSQADRNMTARVLVGARINYRTQLVDTSSYSLT